MAKDTRAKTVSSVGEGGGYGLERAESDLDGGRLGRLGSDEMVELLGSKIAVEMGTKGSLGTFTGWNQNMRRRCQVEFLVASAADVDGLETEIYEGHAKPSKSFVKRFPALVTCLSPRTKTSS
ncbi:hypothetical protein GOBAR_AA04009 [Gossypium barbadense]|uniref:Uncharacterized protein n=1 Tax=Gossypium barbadense TaxID=3634 RepID=A0A2P5YLT3_GOSBA|nr:hypothetical protein GOBAR_AA04009 [Gossypium barbadense]